MGLTAIIILMVPVVIIVAWLVPSIFHVPVGQEDNTILLFLGVFVSLLIRSWAGNFTVQLFAYNRLDLQNLVNITNLIAQTGLIVVLFYFYGPNISLVGGAYLAGAVVASGLSIILARRICPHLKVSRNDFDRAKVKDLSGMAGWVIVNNVGALLFLQIDLIVVNLLFGASSAGKYAIALQWVILLRAVSGVLSNVITPTILSYYAHEQTEKIIQVMKSAVKLMGLAMALPIGLVCGFAPQLLTIWIGPEFAGLSPLMVLLTAHLAVNLAVLPLFSINVAYNRVRVPGVVSLVMGVANIALAVALPILTGWGYYGVAASGAIVLTLKNAFFTPWYAAKVLGIDVHAFTRSMLSGVVGALLLWILANALVLLRPHISLFLLVLTCGILAIIYIGMIWLFGLSTFERKLFCSY
ncbi:polysaccharide biosynthesis protein, partial [archaeon]|nr:polysaccharide biosynthesis protein [archaeon]